MKGLVILLAICVAFLLIAAIIQRPLRWFHRWKLIKVTHKDGNVSYKVLRNGFMGMPFLYSVDKAGPAEDYLGTFTTDDLTYEQAIEVISSRKETYTRMIGRGVEKEEEIRL